MDAKAVLMESVVSAAVSESGCIIVVPKACVARRAIDDFLPKGEWLQGQADN
jgi:hypothetical protein